MAWSRSDDLDGSPATEVVFGVDGQAYAIDLGEANKAKLLKALQPFLTVARPIGEMMEAPDYWPDNQVVTPVPTPAPRADTATIAPPVPPRRTRRTRPETKISAKKTQTSKAAAALAAAPSNTIREWANANGYSVGPTGRIPKAVVDAFQSQTPAS